MANYGWLIGMPLWVLISYVMIGWITFQVCKAVSLVHMYISDSQASATCMLRGQCSCVHAQGLQLCNRIWTLAVSAKLLASRATAIAIAMTATAAPAVY